MTDADPSLSTVDQEALESSSNSNSPNASPTTETPKPRNRSGRPTGLTPAVQERICMYLKAGNFFSTACDLAGVSINTATDWLKRGRGRHSARKGNELYAQFAQAVNQAEAEAEARSLLIIQKAGEKNWTAAAWFLERKFPERWGRVGPYADRLGKMTDEQLDAEAARLFGGAAPSPSGSAAEADD